MLHGDVLSFICPRYDVLFMTEPLDELTVQAIGEYGGKALTDLGKENVDFAGDEDEKAKKEEQSTDTEGAGRGSFGQTFDYLRKLTLNLNSLQMLYSYFYANLLRSVHRVRNASKSGSSTTSRWW